MARRAVMTMFRRTSTLPSLLMTALLLVLPLGTGASGADAGTDSTVDRYDISVYRNPDCPDTGLTWVVSVPADDPARYLRVETRAIDAADRELPEMNYRTETVDLLLPGADVDVSIQQHASSPVAGGRTVQPRQDLCDIGDPCSGDVTVFAVSDSRESTLVGSRKLDCLPDLTIDYEDCPRVEHFEGLSLWEYQFFTGPPVPSVAEWIGSRHYAITVNGCEEVLWECTIKTLIGEHFGNRPYGGSTVVWGDVLGIAHAGGSMGCSNSGASVNSYLGAALPFSGSTWP